MSVSQMTQDMFALSWYLSIYSIPFSIFTGLRPLPWITWRVPREEHRLPVLPEHPIRTPVWLSNMAGATCRTATSYPPRVPTLTSHLGEIRVAHLQFWVIDHFDYYLSYLYFYLLVVCLFIFMSWYLLLFSCF